MNTRSRISRALGCAAALALLGAGASRSAGQALDAETKARIERFEKGAATIDVSKYPAPIQEDYQLFSEKCSQCHKLSRPINSDYCLPDDWSRYVHRMMHKPGSNITAADAKKIYEFLVYDSSVRKKALVQERLDKSTPEERKTAETKIKEIRDKFDQSK